MFGFQSLRMKPEKVLRRLKDFELFCLGEKRLSPEDFKTLNEDLSLSAILHIGKCHFRKDIDGKHLIWQGHDHREHDLGPIDNINVMQDCPGYNRTRTLALAGDQVLESDVINIPPYRKQITIVKMKDGTTGVGPNYKMALRNAALKMHLKCAFEKANRADIWKRYYGNC
ncbi:MAG: hypothetical protein H6861_07015 [Rhodospirillales bacterium]|nr:hypothetical protein [Rhodospirillales bacterium]